MWKKKKRSEEEELVSEAFLISRREKSSLMKCPHKILCADGFRM